MTLRTLPRPRHPAVPVAITVAAMAVWGTVAHSSGVGWVQTLGAVVAGYLVVGLAAPAVAAARARCTVTSCLLDVVAGEPAEIEVATSAPMEVRAVPGTRVAGRTGPTAADRSGTRVAGRTGPTAADGSATLGPPALSGRDRRCLVQLVPSRRGVVRHCTLEVATASPFGLLWWTRRITVPLPRPIHVAPRTGAPDLANLVEGHDERGRRPTVRQIGQTRGVRPYQPGDRRHLVHWPATAHVGSLMTRQTEEDSRRPVTIEAVLPDDPVAADAVAARVMGTVATLLASGGAVELVTVEVGGRRSEPVASLLEAGHRLARATPQ